MAADIELNGAFMTDEEIAEEAKLVDGEATDEGEVYKGKPRKWRNKYFVINIPKSGVPGMKDKPVIVAPQGNVFQIHRGVDVIVPGAVVEVLNNAVETQHEYDDKTKQIHSIDVPSYPVMVKGIATEEDFLRQKKKFGKQVKIEVI